MTNTASRGPMIIAGLVIVLLILHQDNWFWTDDTLVFGFMPVGLFYHALISISASAVWFASTKIAWPIDEDEVRLPQSPAADVSAGELTAADVSETK